MSEQDVLIVVAHADDETLGMGGTMHAMHQEGMKCWVLVCTDGVGGRRGPDGEREAEQRWQEHLRALECLHAQSVVSRHFADNSMDGGPLLDVVVEVEAALKLVQPSLVLTHHVGDLNVDHQVVAQAVMTALRPWGEHSVRRICAMEVPSSTHHNPLTSPFAPTSYQRLDRSGWEAKLAAWACYRSEQRDVPHPRSKEALEALATWRGSQCGARWAEAFELLREVW